MHEQQRQRAHEHLKAQGIVHALFASPASLTWLTGFAPPVQTGPHPFAGGPPLVWYAHGEWTLIVLDAHAELAAASGCDVVSYLGYTIEAPIDGPGHLIAVLRKVAGSSGVSQLGVEERALPLFLRAALSDAAAHVPIDGILAPLRVIKIAEELAKLRANFALTDVGQAAAREAVRPGKSEIDVWNATHAAIQKAAGRRVLLGNDCT